MNITRNNYEEFFILYLDNELSSDDRRQVERFVSENPDLKNEFELLLQTRLTPDQDLVFDGKQQLLKTASPAPINESNFEEWLLLYIDNELTAQERIDVEKFVAAYPAADTVFHQLQKTKLQPELSVTFPNKAILYRREKRAAVVAIRWRKIAVAASLLLAISTAAFFVFTNKNGNSGRIISEQPADSNSTKNGATDNSSTDVAVADTEKSESSEAIAKEVDPGTRSANTEQKNIVSENKENIQHPLPSEKQEEKLIAQNKPTTQPTNNLASPVHNPNITRIAEDNPIAMVDLPKKEALTSNSDIKPIEDVTPDNTSSLNDGKTAVTTEPDYALVTDESGKKNKLRGFFRKVTRTFEKRTNMKATDDEDRLLLAGLSIKL